MLEERRIAEADIVAEEGHRILPVVGELYQS
jgi:hypothetical protein